MKTISTIVIIALFQIAVAAQEFAPVGAIWHVQIREFFTDEWTSTLTNESLRDTMIDDLSCKIIHKSMGTIFNEIRGEYTLCQKGDSIYHHIPELDTMNLVMNFAAEVGDSWEPFDQANETVSFGFMKNYIYTVDSISYITNTLIDSIRVQHISVQVKWNDQPVSEYVSAGHIKLIQYIGFRKALLPRNGGDGFTDDIFEQHVRCYEDPIIGLIKLTDDINCTISAVDDIELVDIKLFPNPVQTKLQIINNSNRKINHVLIYDTLGNLVWNTPYQEELDLEGLVIGSYFVKLTSADFSITKRMIVGL